MTPRFAVCSSRKAWLRDLADAPHWAGSVHPPLPLPEGIDEKAVRLLEHVFHNRAGDAEAQVCPVDAVVGVGDLGEVAARSFSWWTRTPVHIVSDGERCTEEVVEHCAALGHVLICMDLRHRGPGPTDLSTALSHLEVRIGFICSFDLISAVIGATKAAFVYPTTGSARTVALDGGSDGRVDVDVGDVALLYARNASAQRVRELLVEPSHIKVLAVHGNGYDYSIGPAVLCGIDGDIPVIKDAALFPCYQTGECLRAEQVRVPIHAVRSDVLIIAACWGFLDGVEDIDFTRTAYGAWLRSPEIGGIITTAVPWTSLSGDVLRLLGSLAGVKEQGDAVRRLNETLDPGCAAFVLMGNPRMPIRPPRMATRLLSTTCGTSSGVAELPAGLHLLRPDDHNAWSTLLPGAHGDTVLTAGMSRAGTIFVLNSGPVCVRAVPVEELGVAPTRGRYARFARNARLAERLLPVLLDGQEGPLSVGSLQAHARHSLQVAASLAEHRGGGNTIIGERHLQALHFIKEGWAMKSLLFARAMVKWSSSAVAPRLISNEWRRDYRQVSGEVGPPCDVCHRPTRRHRYESLDGDLPDRLLTLCRLCSTKSDLPVDFALRIEVISIVDDDAKFHYSACLHNEGQEPMLLAPAIFLMSAYQTWAWSAACFESHWLAGGATLPVKYAVDAPGTLVPGDHWFVMIGMVDGGPFTYCTRVRVARRGGVRGQVLYEPGSIGMRIWRR